MFDVSATMDPRLTVYTVSLPVPGIHFSTLQYVCIAAYPLPQAMTGSRHTSGSGGACTSVQKCRVKCTGAVVWSLALFLAFSAGISASRPRCLVPRLCVVSNGGSSTRLMAKWNFPQTPFFNRFAIFGPASLFLVNFQFSLHLMSQCFVNTS